MEMEVTGTSFPLHVFEVMFRGRCGHRLIGQSSAAVNVFALSVSQEVGQMQHIVIVFLKTFLISMLDSN